LGDNLSIVNWDNVLVDFASPSPLDEAFHFAQELHVGVPEKGRETCLGEGDSTSRDMLVYKYTDIGSVFTDVSDEAKSATGSNFTMGTAVNDAMYIGWDLQNSDFLKFYGIKCSVLTALTPGAGSAVWEFWDGDSWEEFSVMMSNAIIPYVSYGNASFQETGSHQIRFASERLINEWAKNDPPGITTNRFWVRFRITGVISVAPIFEQFKLHTNRSEINENGWLEYFGTARPISTLPININTFRGPTGSKPGDQDLYLSDNLDVGKEQNEFGYNTTDRLALAIYLPLDVDTSNRFKLHLSWITNDNDGGNVRWVVRWAKSIDGDSIYRSAAAAPATAPNEKELIQITAAPAIDTQKTEEFALDVSDMISRPQGAFGDVLWLSLEREGDHTNDTHDGDVSLLQMSMYYTKWCEGGHQAI
jgi:hypothetical protein